AEKEEHIRSRTNCARYFGFGQKSKIPEEPDSEALKILKDQNLFFKITKDELDKKIVGEIQTRQTIFLCACGAFVENNNTASYNLIPNAESGSGKDWITSKTLNIFPKEMYIRRTRITEKVFTYWHNPEYEPEWTWNGKIFYNEDISNNVLNSEVFKVMTSSGSSCTVLIKQTPVDIEIKGKPVIICTTAKATPDKELLRRFAIVSCDESFDQSKEIIKRQAELATTGQGSEYDENISQALGYLKRINVIIPFAQFIGKKIPTENIIVRTAFPRLLDYIRASCALHQYQRKQDVNGFFIAEKQDYEIALIAFHKTTNNSFLMPLTHEQKKVLKIIEEMRTLEEGLTVDEIAENVSFWEERYLREQLNRLADMRILLTGKKRTEGAKKDSKTYRPNQLSKIIMPNWEELCRNTAIIAVDAINTTNAINALNNEKSNIIEQQQTQDRNNCINCTLNGEMKSTNFELNPEIISMSKKSTKGDLVAGSSSIYSQWLSVRLVRI
ncbi:MAG: hypothetical protein WCT53_06340, partial [Candidatus Gracilibacteria bacterium]